MKIILSLLVLFFSKIFGEHNHKKSIHFKIHVPEIIKHHIHTKTIFIHVHELKPDDDGKLHEENHSEDWTSYNSHNYKNGLEENYSDSYNKKKQNNMIIRDNYLSTGGDDNQPFISPYTYNTPNNFLDNELPIYNENSMNVFVPSINSDEMIDEHIPSADVKTYSPLSQYKIHENVDEDMPSNDINYQKFHEEGYRQGIKTQTGHVIHKDLKDFYNKENKAETFSDDAYKDQNYSNYNTLSYLGKYDKEIGLEQRAGIKRIAKRFMVARMFIR